MTDTSTTVLTRFRRQVRDVRYSKRVFGLSVASPERGGPSPRAIFEIYQQRLSVNVSGLLNTPSIDIDLTLPAYDTVGKVVQTLQRTEGFTCTVDDETDRNHASEDLEPTPPVDILGTGVDVKTHLFSDAELEDILLQAITRHNPGLNLDTLPRGEEMLVFLLGQAIVHRIQAMDAAKRVGMDKDVNALLAAAASCETAYKTDRDRLSRSVISPPEAPSNTIGEGDVVLGSLMRRSGRTGFTAPMSQNLPPKTPILLTPRAEDAEDTNVKVRWVRSRDRNFYSYELWMDTQPEVVRAREGLVFTSVPFAFISDDRSPGERPTTSRLVFRSFGANSNFDTSSFATFVEEFGQSIQQFVKGGLEPEMTYYFRLYVSDLNYEAAASNVVQVTTKTLRSGFLITGTVFSPSTGAPGSTVTVHFEPTLSPVTADHVLTVEGKVVAMTLLDDYTATFEIPTFVNRSHAKEVVLVSPNGLKDVRHQAITVTT